MIDQAEKLRNVFRMQYEENLRPDVLARVITVASGKGGVGKTNFAVNLALALNRLGKRVVVIDADFGLANIELIFGCTPRYTLADVFAGERDIDEIVSDGPMGVKFISGGMGLKSFNQITEIQMKHLLRSFTRLDKISDIVIIDTGAGISRSVVDFVKASKETIVITTPEPTSIADAYALLKSASGISDTAIFKLVVNKADNVSECDEAAKRIRMVSRRFLGIEVEYLGFIPNDQYLVKAVKKQEAVSLSYPAAPFSKAVRSIAEALVMETAAAGNYSIDSKKGIVSFFKRLVNYS